MPRGGRARSDELYPPGVAGRDLAELGELCTWLRRVAVGVSYHGAWVARAGVRRAAPDVPGRRRRWPVSPWPRAATRGAEGGGASGRPPASPWPRAAPVGCQGRWTGVQCPTSEGDGAGAACVRVRASHGSVSMSVQRRSRELRSRNQKRERE